MAPFEVLTYAIDPPAVTGTGEISVHLIVKNQSESWVSNLCLKLSPTGDGLQILGSDTVSGITLKPYTSARLPLRFRARPGEFQIRLHSISLRLDGRSERFSEALLDFHVVKPAVDLSQVSSAPATTESRSDEPKPIRVFVSYSHIDQTLHDELIKHLKPLERERLIRLWHDPEILPGSNILEEIDAQLDSAEIILLLISSDFVNSISCQKEVDRALQRYAKHEARVIPVIARPFDWKRTPFGGLSALPTDGYPIVKWTNQDEAFLNVVHGIRRIIDRLFQEHLDFHVVKPAVDLSQVSSAPATAESRSDKREPVFDVFLCYNSADRPAVKRIAHQLRQAGILPWFDEWESRPGQPWQRQLEQQISTIRASAVFVGPAGVGPWQEQEIWGFLQEFSKRNLPIIPVVLPNAPSVPKVPVLLGAMTWVDFRIDDPHPLQRLIWGITGKRPDDLL
jgi:hypothetical protein